MPNNSTNNVIIVLITQGFLVGASGKESACQCRRHRFDPWFGKSPAEGNGNTLQYSCLENPMDRGAWWAIVHRVTNSWTRLRDRVYIITDNT